MNTYNSSTVLYKVHGIVDIVMRGDDSGTLMHAWMDVLVMVLHIYVGCPVTASNGACIAVEMTMQYM